MATTDYRAVMGRNPEALREAERIVHALAVVAQAEADAEYRRSAGYTRAAEDAEALARETLRAIGDAPSVARIRAAMVLLAGVTDETLAPVIAGALDHLSDVIRRVDDGTL